MNQPLQFNAKLLHALSRVLGKTNVELMCATGLKSTTWYRLMKQADEITVQQLLAISNGLHIPVHHFFVRDKDGLLGDSKDYVAEPYKSCYYDAQYLLDFINARSFISWQETAVRLGLTRNNLRKSLMSVSRLPVSRLLRVCTTLDIDLPLLIIDPNSKTFEKKESEIEMSTHDIGAKPDITAMQNEIAELKIQIMNAQQEINLLKQKYTTHNMETKVLRDPVAFFSGMVFLCDTKGMSQSLLEWINGLIAQYPSEKLIFAKAGAENNSIRFYSEEGALFYEGICDPVLSIHVSRAGFLVGRIYAQKKEGHSDIIEFHASLVENPREDRKDTADLAKFRKEMIKKFG